VLVFHLEASYVDFQVRFSASRRFRRKVKIVSVVTHTGNILGYESHIRYLEIALERVREFSF
jgi:hypothetical protein